MGSPPAFLYHQLTFKPKPLPESVKLDGKTAIITGANVGLGLDASKEMVQHGLSRLIVAVRSLSKGEAARQEILTVAPKCDVQVWHLDYESLESITAFAEQSRSLDRLDIVILCAGLKSLEYQLSQGGHESNVQVCLANLLNSPYSHDILLARAMFEIEKTKMEAWVQVNHFGTSLLSLLLLPSLTNTARNTGAPSRLTIVCSEVHFWTQFTERKEPSILARLDEKASFQKPGIDRYCVSKLLNVLWTRELASRTPRDNVLINCVSPGLCATSLHRTEKGLSVSRILTYLIAFSSVQGARMVTDAAVFHPDEHGGYLSEQRSTRYDLIELCLLLGCEMREINDVKSFKIRIVRRRPRNAKEAMERDH